MIKTILLIALFAVLIVIGPLLTIWAANALFPTLAIGYTIETWAATGILGAFFRGYKR